MPPPGKYRWRGLVPYLLDPEKPNMKTVPVFQGVIVQILRILISHFNTKHTFFISSYVKFNGYLDANLTVAIYACAKMNKQINHLKVLGAG